MNASKFIPVEDYDLDATLNSGQAFRWEHHAGGWEGIIGQRWIRLDSTPAGILARTVGPVADWHWLHHYLQTGVNLSAVIKTFPDDPPLRASVSACRGLRLLRQDPWECLASFILSSTKQIAQIRQVVAALCERFGDTISVPPGRKSLCSFPLPDRLAAATERDLRACKMGFRAPYLLAAASRIASGDLDLASLQRLRLADARDRLLSLPGVGAKIANCVLLFAFDFPRAFPVDVWIRRALRELYFPRRSPQPRTLDRFIARYFGPNAGYAQQYLFHYMRTRRRSARPSPPPAQRSRSRPA